MQTLATKEHSTPMHLPPHFPGPDWRNLWLKLKVTVALGFLWLSDRCFDLYELLAD